MIQKPKKIVAVLNSFDMAEVVLSKSFAFADANDAVVEVIYVHEQPLFELPDYFLSDTQIAEGSLDKEKVRLEIRKRIKRLDSSRTCALFTFINDTANRVSHLVKDEEDILIISAYHDTISKSLLSKVSQSVLLLKGEKNSYEDVALSINVDSSAMDCIHSVEGVFKKSTLHLLYDYRYVVDPSMELDLQNLALIEAGQKAAFLELKKASGLDGKFFVDGSFLGDDLIEYIYTKSFDLVIVCSGEDDFFLSNSLALSLLEDEDICGDVLVAMK